MSVVAVLVLKTHGAGYQAMQMASQVSGLVIVEMIPLGGEMQLIIQGTREQVEKLLSQLSTTELLFTDFIEAWSDSLEKAFYSLEHSPIENEMVIIEGSRLGRLLGAAAACENIGYKIVDLKIPRGSNRWGVLILTLSNATLGQEKLIFDELTVTRISNPSKFVRSYFEIEPR